MAIDLSSFQTQQRIGLSPDIFQGQDLGNLSEALKQNAQFADRGRIQGARNQIQALLSEVTEPQFITDDQGNQIENTRWKQQMRSIGARMYGIGMQSGDAEMVAQAKDLLGLLQKPSEPQPNASLLQFEDKLKQRQAADEILSRYAPNIANIRNAKVTIMSKSSTQDQINEAVKVYTQEFDNLEKGRIEAIRSEVEDKFPKFDPLDEVLFGQEEAAANRQKLTLAIENASRDKAMQPYDMALKKANTRLANAQAGDVGRATEAKVIGDMDKYTAVMDETASNADALIEAIKDIQSGDSQLSKAAKSAITKKVSRAASNEALSEADFGRAAGAAAWKTAIDNFAKTDLAQMADSQAINEATKLFKSNRTMYQLAKEKAGRVGGGRRIIAREFPYFGGVTPRKDPQKSATQDAKTDNKPKKSIKQMEMFK